MFQQGLERIIRHWKNGFTHYNNKIRHQDLLASLGEFATTAHPHGNSAVLLASRKDELVRLHDAHKHIMGARTSCRGVRDRVGSNSLGPRRDILS